MRRGQGARPHRMQDGTAFAAMRVAPDGVRLLLRMRCRDADAVDVVPSVALLVSVRQPQASSPKWSCLVHRVLLQRFELQRLDTRVRAPNYALFASAVGPRH